ncbi:MAG: alpha/beta hydrolase [Acidobacteria bacterium]|nr:alpha/beta hydrolase [Acidobacteriota bacterium]
MRGRAAAALFCLLVTPSLLAQKQKPKKLASDRTTDIQKARVNGTELSYIDRGRGTAVVLVHGSGSDYRIWTSQIRPLAAKYRVIAYSRRYHTPNPWQGDGSDYSAALHAADLAALLHSLKVGPAHLIGHSYGGTVALLVARDHPELVRSVVAMEPGLPSLVSGEEGERARAVRQKALHAARAAVAAGEDERAIQILGDWVLQPRTYRQLSPPIKSMFLENARLLKVLLAAAPAPTNFSCEDAGTLKAPLLLVEGESSADYMVAASRVLQKCQPAAERVAIPHATHNMQLDNPYAFNRGVLEFLAKH